MMTQIFVCNASDFIRRYEKQREAEGKVDKKREQRNELQLRQLQTITTNATPSSKLQPKNHLSPGLTKKTRLAYTPLREAEVAHLHCNKASRTAAPLCPKLPLPPLRLLPLLDPSGRRLTA